MDSGKSKDAKKRPCPREAANPLSALTFWWTAALFCRGYRHELTENDLYEPLREHRSEVLGDVLEEGWQLEVLRAHKAKRPPNLHKVICKVFGYEYMCYGIIMAILNVGVKMLQAIALGRLVSYYSPEINDISKQDAYIYAGIVISCAFVTASLSHPTYMGMLHVGMKIRVAVCSMLYRKSLRLSKMALAETTVGQVVNLLSNDVSRFDGAVILLHNLWIGPLVTGVATYFMYQEIGLSAVAGVTCIIMFVPFQGWLGHRSSVLRLQTAIRTDERLRLMNEIINGIQVIKMYTWEKAFAIVISHFRKLEIKKIKHMSYIRGVIKSFHLSTTRTAIFVTILSYLLFGNRISAQKVFMLTACFNVIKQSMTDYLAMAIMQLAEFNISIKRVRGFLLHDEMSKLPETGDDHRHSLVPGHLNDRKPSRRARRGSVCVRNVCASWSKTATDDTLSGIDLKLDPGMLVALVGPVGSGKSSLLHVILRELPLTRGLVDVDGTVSYAPQEPWLFAGTVRQNILFGRSMNKERYRAVVHRCALDKDFKTFPRGDRTIVGERGVSLSGGQRARISLARAIYKKADVYLLDDPLSAVDTHVAKQLFETCIGSYLHDKTRILVTHQLHYLKHVDEIIILDGGTIKARGTYENLRLTSHEFSDLLDENAMTPGIIGPEDEQKKRLVMRRGSVQSIGSLEEDRMEPAADSDEHRSRGSVSGAVYQAYLKAGGGKCAISNLFLLFLLAQLAGSAGDYFIGYWVNREEAHFSRTMTSQRNSSLLNSEEEILTIGYWHPHRKDCVYLYAGITVFTILVTLLRSFVFFNVCMRASGRLHDNMFISIVQAPMLFFNTNPSGRILNRFSKDIGSVDESLPKSLIDCLQIGFSLIGIFIVVAIVNPFLLLPTFVILIIFYLLRIFYLKTARSVKRLEGITRSPVFSHMNASLQGLTTIRAFGANQILKKEFDNHQDLHSSAWYMLIATSQTFSYYLDMVCVVYIAAVTFSFLLSDSETYGGNVGLAITQVMGLMGILQWGIRQSSEFENQMTSVERMLEYSQLEPESQVDQPMDMTDNWPEQGYVEFHKLSLHYSPSDPAVLKNLSFCINPQEKIGIVGRTGAGKSSLIAALFQLSHTEGQILIDGRDTQYVGLQKLRSSISIIPQEPVLFSGTMRSNLDPFDEHNDHELWTALEEVELKQAVIELADGLDSKMSEGGANFSVGQRQLMCLARAIVRNNRILVLDEATANVDPHTDTLIQTTIRNKFRECTVLTIAHRLHTVMDSDRVLVMDAGTVVEFEHPHILLQNAESYLTKMVHQTGASMAENLNKIAEEKEVLNEQILQITEENFACVRS